MNADKKNSNDSAQVDLQVTNGHSQAHTEVQVALDDHVVPTPNVGPPQPTQFQITASLLTFMKKVLLVCYIRLAIILLFCFLAISFDFFWQFFESLPGILVWFFSTVIHAVFVKWARGADIGRGKPSPRNVSILITSILVKAALLACTVGFAKAQLLGMHCFLIISVMSTTVAFTVFGLALFVLKLHDRGVLLIFLSGGLGVISYLIMCLIAFYPLKIGIISPTWLFYLFIGIFAVFSFILCSMVMVGLITVAGCHFAKIVQDDEWIYAILLLQ